MPYPGPLPAHLRSTMSDARPAKLTASTWPRLGDSRSGGIFSVIWVYRGFVDKLPAGAWMNRSITLRTGQCHVQRHMLPLLARIERGELDATRVITHRLPLTEAPRSYELFKNKQDNCEKVIRQP